ncbi:hypothetical protein [Nocardia iowensis]|uniref:Uncharacterized protein n=1 Tax=Nocardia iowensis TaxID=204891 RepID=A0ABX8RYL9_NOCIO|nr:hypothetical protein [Nocardia iowensis]QXN94764.1 hypothetical protein KV110_17970 [Nocardia iowensis]
MPVPAFTVDEHANSTIHGSAYHLFPTDDAPVRGRVFVDMSEHAVIIDGRRESRPAVEFQFFGLLVEGRPLGNPRCTSEFHPFSTGVRSMVSLGEPGALHLNLGQRVTDISDTVTGLITDLLTAISVEFLTDYRVARYRHWSAEQLRVQANTLHDQARTLEQQLKRAALHAQANAEASYALLASIHAPLSA